MTLSIMWGPTWTQSIPMTKTRNPFRRIPSGITKATSTIRRQPVFRKRWDARMLVMNSTKLDRIPLHSWADLEHDPGQFEHRAVAHQGSPRYREVERGGFRGGERRSAFEPAAPPRQAAAP